MVKNYMDICRGKRTINLVNSNDLKLKELGLEPLYFTMQPLYINLHGDLSYAVSNHNESNLRNDVINMLSIMNSNNYERFEEVPYNKHDAYTLHFVVYRHQIYFLSSMSLRAWKKYSYIREELTKKYDLTKEYYEPTEKEIIANYYEQIFFRDHPQMNEIQYVDYNLTAKEFLDMRCSEIEQKYSFYTDANDLDNNDIRCWINYNANIFMEHIVPWGTKGVYNQDAMHFINDLLQSKLDIFMSLYDLSKKTDDMQKLVHDLLVELEVYREFQPIEIVSPFDSDIHAESLHWEKMFRNASNDILVQLIGFDKIESSRFKTITTTKTNIYEEFYNLILLGYDVYQLPKLIFDEDKKQFRWLKPNDFVQTSIDRECEEELKLIKKYIPYDQRDRFLRN